MTLAELVICVLLLALAATAFHVGMAQARRHMQRQRPVHKLPADVLEALRMHPEIWDDVKTRETMSLAEAMDLIIGKTNQLQGVLNVRRGRLDA